MKLKNQMGGGKTQLKRAFTLAEVLITLVVIGVIAAITVPTLMAQYQKQQLATQMKKTYSTINNGFKLYMAKEGVSNLSETSLWASMNGTYTGGDQTAFQAKLSEVFNIVKHYNQGEFIGDGAPIYAGLFNGQVKPGDGLVTPGLFPSFILADGAIVYYGLEKDPYPAHENAKNYPNLKLKERLGEMFIDVNGAKKPNVDGKDMLGFYLGNDGRIYQRKSVDAAIWNDGNDQYACRPDEIGLDCTLNTLMNNGWEFK